MSIAALNRKNNEGKPIHPVSEYLIEYSNFVECIFAVLGKTIVARETIEYSSYKIVNSIRANEIAYIKTAYLEFIE